MSTWHIFFGFTTLVIIATMIIPQALGLTHATQWGGMYTDGWCSVYIHSEHYGSLSEEERKESNEQDTIVVGNYPPIENMPYTPQFTSETCIAIARTYCGNEAPKKGWTIDAAYPYFRRQYPLGGDNVCDDPPESASAWFPPQQ